MYEAVTTLLGVALGGIIGFLSALYIEATRKRYELKKQIYLEVLDSISESMKFWEMIRSNKNYTLNDTVKRIKARAENNQNPILKDEILNELSNTIMDDDYYYALFKFQSAIYKIILCDCPAEVKCIMEKLTEQDSFSDPKKVHGLIIDELIPAFMKDLEIRRQCFIFRKLGKHLL